MTQAPITKLLVANRGEISCRAQRACKKLGMPCVAVFTDPDALSLHVLQAEESVCLGASPKEYLNAGKLIEVAKSTGECRCWCWLPSGEARQLAPTVWGDAQHMMMSISMSIAPATAAGSKQRANATAPAQQAHSGSAFSAVRRPRAVAIVPSARHGHSSGPAAVCPCVCPCVCGLQVAMLSSRAMASFQKTQTLRLCAKRVASPLSAQLQVGRCSRPAGGCLEHSDRG
jgi:hypothetical protein